ncbi:hypothetical protein J6590_017026 [Homalodisca vitripennis]|nr:hypothetical protein J6590_017026 [Homalodisca vitripennis]
MGELNVEDSCAEDTLFELIIDACGWEESAAEYWRMAPRASPYCFAVGALLRTSEAASRFLLFADDIKPFNRITSSFDQD